MTTAIRARFKVQRNTVIRDYIQIRRHENATSQSKLKIPELRHYVGSKEWNNPMNYIVLYVQLRCEASTQITREERPLFMSYSCAMDANYHQKLHHIPLDDSISNQRT
eukprot:299902_1